MRVDAKMSPAPPLNTAGSRSVAGQRFTLDRSADAKRPSAAPAAASLVTMDALLAVQGEAEAGERRRRSARRGRDLLDSLDRLKIAILWGAWRRGSLRRSRASSRCIARKVEMTASTS
jgi:hypothetical protein